MIRALPALLLLLPAVAHAAPSPAAPGTVRVALATGAGVITLALDVKHAPITAGNFLKYVDGGKFDGTTFYRAARAKGAPKIGFIQGGIDHEIRRSFPPIAHEPTNKTGLKHLDGTISMARNEPGTAMGDFFITVGPAPGMDAHPGKPGDSAGYAAFGRVVGGMAVVKKILATKTWEGRGSGAMRGQMMIQRVQIISARRVPAGAKAG